jgi:hypothetical protein
MINLIPRLFLRVRKEEERRKVSTKGEVDSNQCEKRTLWFIIYSDQVFFHRFLSLSSLSGHDHVLLLPTVAFLELHFPLYRRFKYIRILLDTHWNAYLLARVCVCLWQRAWNSELSIYIRKSQCDARDNVRENMPAVNAREREQKKSKR